jgi:FecR protein
MMKIHIASLSALASFAACLFTLTAAPSYAQSAAPTTPLTANAGTVTHLSGTVTARQDNGSSRVLSVRSQVNAGETLSTATDTYARIKFLDNTEVVLRPESRMKIEAFSYDEKAPQSDNAVFNLLKGGLRSISGLIAKRNNQNLRFSSPTATVGIRGTHLGMQHCEGDCGSIPTASGQPLPDGLHVDVASGAVVITTSAGEIRLEPGQFGFVPAGGGLPAIVPPNQGFRVTMPPNIAAPPPPGGDGRGVGSSGADQCRP